MDFEEMRVIWDSQSKQPLYALDQKALHAGVRRKAQCIEKSVRLFEGFMIGILLAVAFILVGKRVIHQTDWETSMLIGAGLTLLVAIVAAIHLAVERSRRLKREEKYDPSLLGDIDKAISRIDYQVSRLKTFHFWFVLPMAAMTGLTFVMQGVGMSELFGSKIWVLALFLLSLVIYYAAIRIEMRRVHEPRKRSLEALREKLVAEN